MNSLLERIGGATGPDRTLDTEIGRLTGWCFHDNTRDGGCQSDTGFTCLDCGADSWGNVGPTKQKWGGRVPAYTASIDAALTVRDALLSDREVVVFDDKENGCWWAQIGDDNWDEAMDKTSARGASGALALLGVILQAYVIQKADR